MVLIDTIPETEIMKMIIKDVRTKLLRMPFIDPPRWSPTYDRPREIVVVEIETASGVVGMRYLMPLGGGMATIGSCLKELIIPNGLMVEYVDFLVSVFVDGCS